MLSPSPPHLEYISLITNVIALPSPPRVYQFNNKCYRPPLPTYISLITNEYISLITNVIALPSPPRVYQFNNKCYRPPLPT